MSHDTIELIVNGVTYTAIAVVFVLGVAMAVMGAWSVLSGMTRWVIGLAGKIHRRRMLRERGW